VLRFLRLLFLSLTAAAVLVPGSWGQPSAKEGAAKPDKESPSKHDLTKETLSTTRHSITVGGTKLDYEATAGSLILKDDEGKPRASFFFIAYTRTGVPAGTARPLSFVFNGGPGSSSVWLHLGAIGPRRVLLEEHGKSLAPPYRLVDNEATPLEQTDLVFLDPVSTGYSRPAPGQDGKQFHGVQEDVDTNAAFIRLYVTRFNRWDSPKFLIGESYGTTRAAGLVEHLQDREGMNFNGVVLVSTVLNFGTIRFDEGNDLPFILYLPGYTATAWYHKKLSSELQANLDKALAEAEKFALGEYTAALMKGSSLPADERQKVTRQLARLTGLSEEFVRRCNLRIEATRFRKELLRHEERTVGRFDSRFQGIDLDSAGERPDYDPSYGVVQGAYTSLVNQYLRQDLKYETDLTYRILTDRVQPWNYGSARNRYLNVAPSLRQALTKNPGLRVLVASGLYDLATPYFATRYTVNQLGLDPALAGHVTVKDYPAGHMMYTNEASLLALKKDLAQFIRMATAVSK